MNNKISRTLDKIPRELKFALVSLFLVLMVVSCINFSREAVMNRDMFVNKMYDVDAMSATIDDWESFFVNPLAYNSSPKVKDANRVINSPDDSLRDPDLESYGREVLESMQLFPEWAWHKAGESLLFSGKYAFACLGVILGAIFLRLAVGWKQAAKVTLASTLAVCLTIMILLVISRLIIVGATFSGIDQLTKFKQVVEAKDIWHPHFSYNLGVFLAAYIHGLIYLAFGLLLFALTKLVLPVIIFLIALPTQWVSLVYSIPVLPMYYFNRTINKYFVSLASPLYYEPSPNFTADIILLFVSLVLLLALDFYVLDRSHKKLVPDYMPDQDKAKN